MLGGCLGFALEFDCCLLLCDCFVVLIVLFIRVLPVVLRLLS